MQITHPAKVLRIDLNMIEEAGWWEDDESTDIDDTFIGMPFQWKVEILITPQFHNDMTTEPTPNIYDGNNIEVGDFVLMSDGGRYLKIIEIFEETVTAERIECVIEDTNLKNLLNCDGSIFIEGISTGPGILFSANESDTIMYPLPSDLPNFISPTGYTEALSRYQIEHPITSSGGIEFDGVVDLGEIK